VKQLGGIVTTSVPSAVQVFRELLHLGRFSHRGLSFRKLSGSQPSPDCLSLNLEGVADRLLRVPLPMQRYNLLVTFQSMLPALLLSCLWCRQRIIALLGFRSL
jgi:hypothetical protein